MGIRVAFEPLYNGRPLAEAARLGFRYSCLVGLISMLIGLWSSTCVEPAHDPAHVLQSASLPIIPALSPGCRQSRRRSVRSGG
jgi:hypothetical protein